MPAAMKALQELWNNENIWYQHTVFSMHTNELATCIQAGQPPSGTGGGEAVSCRGVDAAVSSVVAASSLLTVASAPSVFSLDLLSGSATKALPSPVPGPGPDAGVTVVSVVVAIAAMLEERAEVVQSCTVVLTRQLK